MRLFRSLVFNLVFFLNVLLLFLTFYRRSLDVPPWLHAAGRLHPMLLHIPIGLIILSVLVVIFKNAFKRKAYINFINFVVYFAALSAAATAVMGVLLSTEEGYNADQLNRHLITGVGVSLMSWWLLWIVEAGTERRRTFNISLAITTALLLLAGHFGSVITHGENYVFQPFATESEQLAIITDSTALYNAAIEPILRSRCGSCHNEKKAKGQLIVTSLASALRGGKNGPAWIAGDPGKSNIIKRIHLPEDHDDHMPPSGKPQLSAAEIQLLELWILRGADTQLAWTRFDAKDSLRRLAEASIQQHRASNAAVTHYTFPYAESSLIAALNSPSRTIAPIALTEPALQADFFLAQNYTPKSLEELLPIREQLVVLNLSRMPVTDADGKTLAQFSNLEKLNLNNTSVSGAIAPALASLPHLESLSLIGTGVDLKSLEALQRSKSLKYVFLWNTAISKDALAAVSKKGSIHFDGGFETHDTLRMTPPILLNENMMLGDHDAIRLKHNLPGAVIRYTLDGTTPDSTKGLIFDKPVTISGFTQFKTRAFKDGWYSSPTAGYYFFRKGVKPLNAELANQPNKDYKGEGAATLIDGKKGSVDDFRSITWLAFREKPLDVSFELDPSSRVSTVTLSYSENPGSYIFPPASVELWSGNDKQHLTLEQRIVPKQPTDYSGYGVKGLIIPISESRRYYRLVAVPVAHVPAWITKKHEKAWVFTDEVIFN